MDETGYVNGIAHRKQRFARQLIKSHLLVAFIGFAMLLVALASTYYLRAKILVLVKESVPVVQASSRVVAEVQHSLAGLRGWVSLGDEELLDEWKDAWAAGIEPAMASLMKHRDVLMRTMGEEMLNQLRPQLAALKASQWWVKSVAQTLGNEPAKVSYLLEVEPIAFTIDSIIEANINELEKSEELVQKEKIIKLTNAARLFSIACRLLETIAFEGGFQHEKAFRDNLRFAMATIDDLALHSSYSPEYQPWSKFLRRELQAFQKLSDKIIKQRKSDKWNAAQYLMAKETVPIAKNIIEITNKIYLESSALMRRESFGAARATNAVMIVMFILICIMIFITYIISKRRAQALTKPVAALSIAAQEFAKGKLKNDIPVMSNDELGELTCAFNLMRRSIDHAQKELSKANEELSQYASAVAHDLKAPLRAIHNYADFLREDLEETLDGEQKQYLSGLCRAISEADGLIRDLLEFSQIGQRTLSVETVDMSVFLRQLIDSLSLPPDVTILMKENWPSIEVEPILLRQVFQNLIDNSIKFNNSSEKQIELGWQTLEDGSYEFFVCDNGIGIEPHYQKQIFRVFERLHTKDKYDGTGMGLAIVMKATSRLGGSICVESKPGKGSTFSIILPKTKKGI